MKESLLFFQTMGRGRSPQRSKGAPRDGSSSDRRAALEAGMRGRAVVSGPAKPPGSWGFSPASARRALSATREHATTGAGSRSSVRDGLLYLHTATSPKWWGLLYRSNSGVEVAARSKVQQHPLPYIPRSLDKSGD